MKKAVCNQLVTKVNGVKSKILSITGFINQLHYDTDKQNQEKKIEDANQKICDTNRLVKKLILTQKILRLKVKHRMLLIYSGKI